jgi:hypothetical protein
MTGGQNPICRAEIGDRGFCNHGQKPARFDEPIDSGKYNKQGRRIVEKSSLPFPHVNAPNCACGLAAPDLSSHSRRLVRFEQYLRDTSALELSRQIPRLSGYPTLIFSRFN